MTIHYNLRAISATVLEHVLHQGQSLSTVLPRYQKALSNKDRALLQELSFGTLRVLPQLEWLLAQLIPKSLPKKQRIITLLLYSGLYQLIYTRIPEHAVVAETVKASEKLKYSYLKKLVNAVLRQFIRNKAILLEQSHQQPAALLHPNWLINELKMAYPHQWQNIIAANNEKPPMWLRVNHHFCSTEHYFEQLKTQGILATRSIEVPCALRLLQPCNVEKLPGFNEGWVSVQDLSAQKCAFYLEPKNEEHILDICAAPGGKTTHLLELAPHAKIMAIDIDEHRLQRVKDNLSRLKQQAIVQCGDALEPEKWANKQLFDKILLDAPCSATGVIRRHPDIKWLRRNEDISALAELQKRILRSAWSLLKPGGTLLYVTCSLLPEENKHQIQSFIKEQSDATLIPLSKQNSSLQVLPEIDKGDGFFYAKLIKQK